MIILLLWIQALPIFCQSDSKILTRDDNTPLQPNEIGINVLWQYRTTISVPFHDLGVSNTNLIVSDNVLLYWQPIDTANCLFQPLMIALDVENGTERWRHETDNFVSQLFAVEGGFLIVNPVRIMLMNVDGEKIWEKTVHNTELDLRSISTVSERNGTLIIATEQSIFYVHKDDGTVIKKQNLENAVHVENNQALVISGEHQLQLVDISDSEVIYSLDLKASHFHRVRINELFPRVARFDHVLLLYYETQAVEAYDYRTGKFLWEIEKPIYTVPTIVADSLAIFTPENSIELYNLFDGTLDSAIAITRQTDAPAEYEKVSPLFLVQINGTDSILLVRDLINAQLFAIQL